MTEAFAMALLACARGVSYLRRERLLSEAGGALAAVAEPEAYRRALGEEGLAGLRRAIREADALSAYLERRGVSLLARGDAGYPPLLAQTARPPHVLFVQGRADLADPVPFAIVGTRAASDYGLRHTREIARELAREGVCVVSGLALGVDAAAHRGALDGGGRTVAVLGGALDRFYPAENLPLRERILASGGSVVSEFPPGVSPSRYSFLQRNRIIAGMCLGTLVTEGRERSGALRTASDALDEGREVFALPGSVDSPLSSLPHRLLSEGAHPATCARDILSALIVEPARESAAPRVPEAERDAQDSPEPEKPKPAPPSKAPKAPKSAKKAPAREAPPGLDAPGRAVYAALMQGEADFDALAERAGIPADELGALLTLLELDGCVEALPGLRYRLAEE